MKQIFPVIVFVSLVVSCGKKETLKGRLITNVEVKHILVDSLLNVRAMEIIDDKKVFFVTSNGHGGLLNYNNVDSRESVVFPIPIAHDSLQNNFRSFAATSKFGFALTIASPARLYKIKNDEKKIVYQENHPKAFYDAMEFSNDDEGIAIGDTTEDCLSIIITRDGGESWTKIPCENLPQGLENEGAFAASDTNIAIVGDNTWVATSAGRVFYSPDKGISWEVIETPIVKDKETEGIYSIAFNDPLNGFAIGGDYTKPEVNEANKIRTVDGGKTWKLVAKNKNPGYRSCVQYVTNSEGKELVAIGFKGIDYSNDSGESWKHLSDDGFYTIRFFNDSVAYAAGAGRISKLLFKE